MIHNFRVQNLKFSYFFQADHNNDGFVDKEEFYHLVCNKDKSFTKRQESIFRQYLQVVAYAEEYRWWPPPWFIITITISQIIFFLAHRIIFNGEFFPHCSYLIYSPFRRKEVWRFFTYMLLHVDVNHLLMNMVLQVMVGLPLEMSHGTRRLALVYGFGVISGSLATSVCDTTVFLAGASGGIYALVTAHLATLILNWTEDMAILQQRFRRKAKTAAAKFHGRTVRFLRYEL